jgi:hypothetical protein
VPEDRNDNSGGIDFAIDAALGVLPELGSFFSNLPGPQKAIGIKVLVLLNHQECDYPPIVGQMQLAENAGQEEFSAPWRPP